ncbi:hypothetical protein SAMN05421630_105381 [Prauserella marina]|uniref:Uncharacterized protein n=1 Tax=Prauserella marina TaxID=530584 RepID=A0A1G6RPK4_9PSEU|nr:hypothetical protein DES30_105380 [Prauserella marina]SDD05866.1 hypothetical protein SAMN05421630_105381 [Prauserella marina]
MPRRKRSWTDALAGPGRGCLGGESPFRRASPALRTPRSALVLTRSAFPTPRSAWGPSSVLGSRSALGPAPALGCESLVPDAEFRVQDREFCLSARVPRPDRRVLHWRPRVPRSSCRDPHRCPPGSPSGPRGAAFDSASPAYLSSGGAFVRRVRPMPTAPSVERPSSVRRPASGVRHPASSIRRPAPGTRHPAPGARHPGGHLASPTRTFPAPTGISPPGRRSHRPGRGPRRPGCGSRRSVRRSRHPECASGAHQRGSHRPERGSRRPGCGSRRPGRWTSVRSNALRRPALG